MAESNRQDCMRDLLISVDYSTFFIIQPTVSPPRFARRALSFPPGVDFKK